MRRVICCVLCALAVVSLISGCSGDDAANSEDISTNMEQGADGGQADAVMLETVQFNGFAMDIPAGWAERYGDLTAIDGVVQLQQSEDLFLTISVFGSTNNSSTPSEDNPSVNSALMDLEAGRGSQVDVDGHIGCLQKSQYGSEQKYVDSLRWFVDDTSYSVSVSYPQSEYDYYAEFIDDFYRTIEMKG